MELADAFEDPKSEDRSPKEIRSPKPEKPAPNGAAVRNSGLGITSDSGIRASDLYVPHTLREELKLHGRLTADSAVVTYSSDNLLRTH
jgi:hypothetical protein